MQSQIKLRYVLFFERTSFKKALKMMKLLTLILFTISMQVSGHDKSQITLSETNIPLQKVLQKIILQTGYDFVCTYEALKKAGKVSVKVRNVSLQKAMEECLKGKPLTFEIIDKTVVIKLEENKGYHFSNTSELIETPTVPPVEIHGKVVNQEGDPLENVSVLIEGTQIGTTTNTQGLFKIIAPDNKNVVLKISSVGFQSKKVKVTGKNEITIVLELEIAGLSDVVVVGYGTQKKVNLTGAVNQISSKVLEDKPVSNLSQALQGVSPNLNITFNDGHPGSGGTFNIRGLASLTNKSGSPLVLIDGIQGDINLINPHDVESISVLKDAASSAIYGARGAFGVILVTTKKGKMGELQVNYSSNYGTQSATTNTDFTTDGYTQAFYTDEAFKRTTGSSYTQYSDQDYEELKKRRTDKSLPSVVVDNRGGKDMYIYYGNTDWWHTFFRDSQSSMEQAVNVTGGSEKIDFLLSGRYYTQSGIMKINQDKFNAYNFRSKINAHITPWLSINSNTQFTAEDYTYPGLGYNSNFVSTSVHALASFVPQNPDGTATFRTGYNTTAIGDGLFAKLLQDKSKGKETSYDFRTTIGANINVTKGFILTANYTFNLKPYSDYQRRTVAPYSSFPEVIEYTGNDQLNMNTHLDKSQSINLFVNYDKKFGDHNLSGTAGFNQEFSKFHTTTARRINLLSEDLNELDLGTGEAIVGSNSYEWALRGYFGRLNYNYKGKYLVEVNGRYDGSSRFPKTNRFGFFPSVSAGWRISEEPFFESFKTIINEFKIRGSYGSLGNQQINSSYPYIPVINTGLGNYITNGSQTQYLSSPSPIDPNFTWEKAATINGGIDFGLFKNQLVASVDIYQRKTTDMITAGPTLPAVFGTASPKINAADLVTEGFDLSINWNSNTTIRGKAFNYNFGVILSDYTAKILRFNNPSQLLSNFYAGQRVGDIWGYSLDGYFSSDKEAQEWPIDQTFVNRTRLRSPGEWNLLHAGDVKFIDLNGDKKIDNGKNTLDDHGDIKVIGNQTARYSFAITGGASWNNFNVSFLLQGIGKQNWYPGNNADKFWGYYSRSYFSYIPKNFEDKIWSADNPNAYFPLLRGYSSLNAGSSLYNPNDKYLQDLAYIRLKNLTIGYNFPKSLLTGLKRNQVRVYFSGQNLFTLTKLETKYIDPEQAMSDANGRVYPFFKVYSIGLNLTF